MADGQDFEGSGPVDIYDSEADLMGVDDEEGFMQRLLDVLTEERSWQETVRLATTLASLLFLILSLFLNLYIIVNICCKKRIQVFCPKRQFCFKNLLVLLAQIYCNGSCTSRLSSLSVSLPDRSIIRFALFPGLLLLTFPGGLPPPLCLLCIHLSRPPLGNLLTICQVKT